MVGLELLSLAGSGGEDDEAGSVVAETDREDVAGVAEDAEAALGEEVDVASCIGLKRCSCNEQIINLRSSHLVRTWAGGGGCLLLLLLGGGGRCCSLLQGVMLPHHGGDVPLLRLPVLLKLLHAPVVGLDLLPEYHILYLGSLLIKFHAGHAVKPLHVEVALPPHTDAIDDQGRFDVDLIRRRRSSFAPDFSKRELFIPSPLLSSSKVTTIARNFFLFERICSFGTRAEAITTEERSKRREKEGSFA